MSISIMKLTILLLLPIIYKVGYMKVTDNYTSHYCNDGYNNAVIFHILSIGFYYMITIMVSYIAYFITGEIFIASNTRYLELPFLIYGILCVLFMGIHLLAVYENCNEIKINPIHMLVFVVLIAAYIFVTGFLEVEAVQKDNQYQAVVDLNEMQGN